MKYFLDTEFNGMGGKLISLALVAEDNSFIYMAAGCGDPNPWVRDHVMPIIEVDGARPFYYPLHHFGWGIKKLTLGDPQPTIIADWPDDIKYFCECLITGPGQMIGIASLKFELHRVDAYPTDLPGAVQHNALWDARALRHKLIG